MRALAALIVAVALATPAQAATTARLPLAQRFRALALSTTGATWVTASRGFQRGAWGAVDAAGRPQWHAVRAPRGFLGLLAPRPDGGMWVVVDDRSALRVGADGSVARFSFRAPPGGEGVRLVAAALPDGG